MIDFSYEHFWSFRNDIWYIKNIENVEHILMLINLSKKNAKIEMIWIQKQQIKMLYIFFNFPNRTKSQRVNDLVQILNTILTIVRN